MAYYFGSESVSRIGFFGLIHILSILFVIISIFLIYKYRNKLKKVKNAPIIMSSILLLNIIIYILGGILGGEFEIGFHIPLQYCYITGFVFIYALLFKKEKVYNFIYYAVFFCTLAVIIFRDPTLVYDRYHFILSFISHHVLLLFNFYALFVLGYKPNKKGIIHFVIYSFIVYFFAYIVNYFFDTNFVFQDSLPLFMYEYFPIINDIPVLILFIGFSVPMLLISYNITKVKTLNIDKNKA